MPSGCQRAGPGDPVLGPPPPALTLNPMPPFLQHRQASMRAMTVKSPEKDTATTDREDDQENSLSGAPSAEGESGDKQRCVPVPGARRGQLDPIPGSALPPTCCGLSLSTLTVAPRPGTRSTAARPRAGGPWGQPQQPKHAICGRPLGTTLASPGDTGLAELPFLGVHGQPPGSSGSQGCRNPLPHQPLWSGPPGLSHCLSSGVALVEAVRPWGYRRGTQAPLSGRD